MSGSKSISRTAAVKRDGSLRYATRHLTVEKGKRGNQTKDSNVSKSCDCLQKFEVGKGTKHANNSKLPVKKGTNNKFCISKDGKNKTTSANHREKVVIVSKRSSSVSVVKSCKLRKSVSVKKVSYSTSVVLSSDEDTDSDDESEEETSRKTRTVVKRTTSKVKSSFSDNKKFEKRSAQKAKAIKLLCEKLSAGKHKDALADRELRPRFPYSMLQEIPTARTHRMASLNALAKVHVLYENEGKTVGESLNDADETTLIDFLNENSDEEDEEDEDKLEKSKAITKKECKQSSNASDKKSEKSKSEDKQKNDKKGKSRIVETKSVQRRKRKRKASDVEIIDTRICKRMASLNAQAILAASYLQEPKPKRIPKKASKCDSSSDTDDKEIILESKCDIEIIETEDEEKKSPKLIEFKNKSKQALDWKTSKENSNDLKTSVQKSTFSEIPCHSHCLVGSETDLPETLTSNTNPLSVGNNSVVATTTSTKVGMYTEVTKVQINTCKEAEIKEESKSERKIEHILSNDDVAITQMYHYQSKNSNESYCVQMQTTYKPGSKNITPPSVALSPNNPIHEHLNKTVMPGNQNYYGGPNNSPILPPQPYHIRPNIGPIPPVMGLEHRVPRQYGGSAFTVPHYRQPHQSQFSRNEYGYYQPAGPLIQPTSEHYTIHKPVPYHPQPNLQHPLQGPQPTSHHGSYHNFPSHQSPSNSSGVDSRQSQVSHRQRHIISACPPPLEILPPQPKHPRYSRCPNDGIQSKGFNTPSKYEETPKRHSLSMGSTFSSQNYSSYNKEKPKAFEKYSQPYEQKDHSKQSYSRNLAYNANQNFSNKQPHSSQLEHISHSEVQCLSSSASDQSHYKSSNSDERQWGVADDQNRIAPSSFTPFQEDIGKISTIDLRDSPSYPARPPSVIEIIDDNPRDTKTYIQLEVPRNSHREKIVVVDVENDEIEQTQTSSSETEKNNKIAALNTPSIKSLQDVEKLTSVKVEKPVESVTPNRADVSISNKTKDSADITILEVKKKKESAVVRRARLHGKQRTFRDCYNRPLAQLSRSKKAETPSISGEHLGNKFQPQVTLPRLVLPKPLDKKPIHGWSWEGPTQEQLVYISNDQPPCTRNCYPSIRHVEGDVICVKDSVFLRSGPRKTDLPFVAKISALWENPNDGEMNMSLLWYYRPEHTDTGKKINYAEDEIFASKHRDTNSVACIEDKCYVLTYAEYCRYKKRCRLIEDNSNVSINVVPEGDESLRSRSLPPCNVSPDLVLFCKKVYDYRQKRLLKNPV